MDTWWTSSPVGAINSPILVINKHLRMSKWGDRLKKVEQLAQSFQLKPLASRYKPRLWPCQPSSVWKLFPRQSMAISFAQSCKEVTWEFCSYRTISFSSLCVKGDCWHLCLHFLDRPCFCTWKRKHTAGSKDLPGYQLQWAVALLQVNITGIIQSIRSL